MGRRSWVAAGAVFGALFVSAASTQAAFDPVYEAKNFSKTTERAVHITDTLDYQLLLRTKNVTRELQAVQLFANDPERIFFGQLCWQKLDGCAGDVRMYDWVTRGAGIALPVLYTARNGSSISGHLWATAQGDPKRPAIVLTSGSVQAPEELYWFAAQALAKAGYVVLTWDVQGQGYSDTGGEGSDFGDGVPSQTGRPFYDGTEDALDFMLSTPSTVYVPRKSCTSGTSHAAKQQRRVKAGLNSAYNPLHGLIDSTRIGLIGQSLGAGAVSYVGQIDPRVDAIVGMDNLSSPAAQNLGSGIACASGSSPRPAQPPVTKPGLGISNDYGLLPQPNLSEPDPDGKTAGSKSLSGKGVDSMEVVIRGGTHYEGAFIPNVAFGGTLRGNDLEAWYLVAWFDKYVKGDPTADARLLTDRWRHDDLEAAVDPDHDGNQFSRYYRSRIQIHPDAGGEVRCESLREAKDCPALQPDKEHVPYEVVATVQARETSDQGPGRDAAKGWGSTTDPAGATGVKPAANAMPSALPAAVCADKVRPTSTVAKKGRVAGRTGVRLHGTATDRGCHKAKGRVARVLVAVAKVEGSRCRYMRDSGKLADKRGSCRYGHYLVAKGTRRWTFATRRALPKGSYRIYVRAVDAGANVEAKKTRSSSYLRLRVR